VNALALIKLACDESAAALPTLSEGPQPPAGTPRSMQITRQDAQYLDKLLGGELQRHRALVHIANLRKQESKNAAEAAATPLVDKLNTYPAGGVDPKNLVQWPPKLALIPVKPIFLDVAWNYIDYPKEDSPKGKESIPEGSGKSAPAPQKKGWFGFGR